MPTAVEGVFLRLGAVLLTAPFLLGSHPDFIPPPLPPPEFLHPPPVADHHWFREPVPFHPAVRDVHVWVTSLHIPPPRKPLFPPELFLHDDVAVLKIRYRPLAYLLARISLRPTSESKTTTAAPTTESTTTTVAPITESTTTTVAPTTESTTTTVAPTTESTTTTAAPTAESTTTTAAPTSESTTTTAVPTTESTTTTAAPTTESTATTAAPTT